MNRILSITLLAVAFAVSPVRAQLKINLDSLTAKAKESVDVSLDGSLLQVAGKFLSADKSDDAKAKELISKLKGIYVRSFEFEKEGQYSQSDLDPIRAQLQAPGWSRIINVREKDEGAEIHLKTEGGRAAGLAIIAFEPRELTVVYIVGPIDLSQLSGLEGHFGIPAVSVPAPKKKATK